jgi:hypothetical protein
MEIHGSLRHNLQLALESSKRLRGHPIHRDTLAFWSELISEARARRAPGDDPDDPEVDRLVIELGTELAEGRAHTNL